jgi:RNA polymerase sigma factor (sigma-70 family)
VFGKRKRPDSQLSDEEIVAELQARMDADRFSVLYDRYTARVYQKCIGMTRDRDLSKDLVHDIFLKAFVNLGKFDHRSKFGTWLYSITYNYCLDHLRKQQRRKEDDIDEERGPSEHPDDDNESRLLGLRAERLEEVLHQLDPADRALLLMKYQEDLPITDIMQVLAVSESAVKMRLMRARERAIARYHETYREEP